MGHDAGQIPSFALLHREWAVPDWVRLFGYLIPSDSFVGRRQLERTEANEDQEEFFSHHRCSPEVGNRGHEGGDSS